MKKILLALLLTTVSAFASDNPIYDKDMMGFGGQEINQPQVSNAVLMDNVARFSIQLVYDVDTPSAATATDTDVNIVDNTIAMSVSSYVMGLKGQFTSTGTLPTGLSTSTDYFVIVASAGVYKFATSLANAIAGTAVDITNAGTAAATITFTPTSIAGGSVQMQKSNDGSNWSNLGSAVSIAADGADMSVSDTAVTYKWVRVSATATAGQYNLKAIINAKGDALYH